jgi:hypothetical protein
MQFARLWKRWLINRIRELTPPLKPRKGYMFAGILFFVVGSFFFFSGSFFDVFWLFFGLWWWWWLVGYIYES